MSKKKLLVILGSGSSLTPGMPSVPAIDKLMRKWSADHAEASKSEDYFNKLWTNVEKYYALVAGRLMTPQINYEKILSDMLSLSDWMIPPPYGNTFRQTASAGAPPPDINFVSPWEKGKEPKLPTDPPFKEYGPSISVGMNIRFLLTTLAKHFRDLCINYSNSDPSIQYNALFPRLNDGFDVGIYNLNYDNVALSALPDAFTGFTEGAYDPSAILERSQWEFIYHLHGSVHFSVIPPGSTTNPGAIEWKGNLREDFNDVAVMGEGEGGMVFPRSTFVAGGFKLNQLLYEPYHLYLSMLATHAYEADAILIGGYGFSDLHVNQALAACMENREARPRVMILSAPAQPNSACMEFRNDKWAFDLCRFLKTDGKFFREPGHKSPPDIFEIAKKNAFEVDSKHGIGIWHGGFVEAEARIDAIREWLNGSPDEVLEP